MVKSQSVESAVSQAQDAVAVIDANNQALAPYLDNRPYNQERLIDEVEFYYQQHAATAFEVGRRLIALKSNCEHGQFGRVVLERVGITAQHASALMAFARTIVESAALTNGKLDIGKMAAMDQRKILLLGDVIAESPEEVEATGKIGGRTLDEWDAMTRAELKATIRKQQERITEGVEQTQRLKDKVLKEQDRVRDLLSATPNAVCASVTHMGSALKNALASFDQTAQCDDELTPDSATILDLVSLRAQLRTFYDQTMALIEERFPAVLDAEVPTDMDLTAPTGRTLDIH